MNHKLVIYEILKENIIAIVIWIIIYFMVLNKITIRGSNICFILTMLVICAIFKYLSIIEKKEQKEKLIIYSCNFTAFIIIAAISGFLKVIFFLLYMVAFYIVGILYWIFKLITT
ncbi:hypothetical protein [Endomicrobium proavitum]|uniref:Uncharacterized protein n=1 Tax=Endomicrobium proavitum TaxID=1408281 RepID=A0A0G3WJZ1_9BACT|nr:hypothetical protein [Endomicrobium proavitum]AKL98197.1 membrane protein of unknown function [Endomicrobium proavitum]